MFLECYVHKNKKHVHNNHIYIHRNRYLVNEMAGELNFGLLNLKIVTALKFTTFISDYNPECPITYIRQQYKNPK